MPAPRFSMNFAIGESGGGRLEHFERRLSRVQECRADALRRDLLAGLDVQAQHVLEERKGRLQIAHRDPDVIQDRFHLLVPGARCPVPG